MAADGTAEIEVDLSLNAKKVLDTARRLRETFQTLTSGFDGEALSESFQESIDTMQDMIDVSQDVFDSIRDGNDALIEDGAEWNSEMRRQLENVMEEYQRYSDERIAQIRREMQEEQFAEQQARQIQNTITTIARGTLSNIRNIINRLRTLTANILKAGAAVVRSGLSKLGSIFFGASGGVGGFNSRLKQGIKTVLSYTIGIASLTALFGKLKSAATEAFQRMAKQIPEVNKDISALKNSFQNLKNSIGTMFQPLLAALTPLITRIVNGLTQVIDKVAQFIAALTGQKYVYKATAANIDYAKSLDKSTKAAKKNQNQLGEYDKLQVIGKKDDDSGKYDADAAKGTYQKVPIDPKYLKWLEWLKDMWKNGDFFKLGQKFASWLKNLLKQIPWEKIKSFMGKLGKSIASFFNGIFADLELAWELGNAVAQAFNSLLTLAYEFVKEFNFKQFGKWVGSFISSALSNVDWDMLKDFAKRFGRGLADAIRGLAESNAIREIGNAIGNILRAAIDFAFEFVTNFPFEDLTREIVRGLRAFFARMNEVDETGLNGWQKLGKTISDALIGILHSLNTVLSDENVRSGVATAITDFFNSIDFATILSESAELIANIASGILLCIRAALESDSLREQLLPVVIGLFAAIFGVSVLGSIANFVATTFLQGLVRGIAEGLVSSAATGTVTAAAEAATATATRASLGTMLKTFWSFINLDFATVAADGGAFIGGTIALGIVGSLFAAIKGMEAGKKLGEFLFPDDKELYEHYKGITGSVKLIGDYYVTLASQVWEVITGMWNTWVANCKQTFEWVKQGISWLSAKISQFADWLASKASSLGFFVNGNPNTRPTRVTSSPVSTSAGAGVHLAKGAVIPPNREFLATLGDQKNGVNIETPLSTMVDAFKTALQENGGMGSNQPPILLQLEGRTIASVMWDEQDKRYKQTGQYSPRMA